MPTNYLITNPVVITSSLALAASYEYLNQNTDQGMV